ncbi:DUF998 domain-containing protein [Actinoplanes sp. NPDC051851]|uniref:DUF998 domain-containing protein n=1 Tax=Actinoplanes sp. NPDC051851 TaxID=3154753 RepID=UPI00342657F0
MRTDRLLLTGAAAGPLFVLVVLVPTLHHGRSPALSPSSWMQAVTFLVCGALSVLLAAGLGRGPGPAFIALWGVSLIGAGVFPANTTATYPGSGVNGLLNILFSLTAVLAVAGALITLRHTGGPAWRRLSLFALVAYALCTALALPAAALLTWWTWLTALAVHALRAVRDPAVEGRGATVGA